MKPWFDVISLRDAKALRRWWNAHTLHQHFIVPSSTNPRYYCLVRTA